MSFFRLLLANLWYHKRANLAILLGVVVGTTVLTGALLFGTSLRGSLGALVLRQLGPVDLALIRSDFFQQKLAEELGAENVVPALFLQTAVGKVTKNGTQDNVGVRVPAVVLYGVDSRFWASGEDNEIGGLEKQFWDQDASDVTQEGVVLGAALAGELEVKAGDKVSLTLQKLSSAPRESILGHKDTRKVLAPITIEVKAVLPENHFGSRFSLNPNISTAKNAFVPLAVLQRQLLLTLKDKSIFPKKPINAILVCGDASPDELQKDIQDVWLSKSEDEETALAGLKDWGVHIREPNVRREGLPWDRYLRKWPYWSLESRSVFVPEVVKKAVGETDLQSAPTLVYLVNTLSSSKAEEEVPYCIVAAVDVNAKPPLGPFLGEGLEELKDDEILLTDWDQGRLGDVPKGSQVTLKYFDPNSHSQTKELTQAFTVAAHVSLPTQPKGVFFDPFLAPRVAGITDQDDPGKWDAPFPYDRSRIQTKDKQYWRNYKTTPKGIITLEAGRKLWGNRYGDTTSIRIANKQLTQEQAAHKILSKLDPQRGGFVFREIRKNALKASQNGPPIGVLFLGFSLFLIIAALLLIGLLFRLNIDKRASEMGILLGVGYRRNIVRRLLLLEGAVVALIGGIIGVGLAIWYADFSLDYLAENWPGGFDRSLLQLHINPSDLALGYLGAFLVSILTIWWSTRVLGQVVPRDLINGQLTSDEARAKDRTFFWSKLLMGVGIVGAIGCFSGGFFTQDPEVQAGSFFGSGILLLTAGLANARYLMLGRKQGSMTQGGLVGLATLGIRNAARHPTRSLLTMGLLASATFLVVAVQAFQRSPMETFSQKTGGSGGFAVLVETELPVFENLNDPLTWQKEELTDTKEQQELLSGLSYHPFRQKRGDDASCLNLFKPQDPAVMGVPDSIIERGGFQFKSTLAKTKEEQENPWNLLKREIPNDGDTPVVPVFVENNTAIWGLKTELGGTFEVTDGRGEKLKLKIVGLLRDSVFQSEALMANKYFTKHYPQVEGFQFFLVGDTAATKKVQLAIRESLALYGPSVESSASRVQDYLGVVNTYLAMFQALGALSLILGALGLAVVLLRSVWERRGELALLKALGFRTTSLVWLVLAENVYLLVLGLIVGTVAAFVSVLPHILGSSEVPWLQLVGLLLLVLVVGLLSGLFAVMTTLRAPLIPALRRE